MKTLEKEALMYNLSSLVNLQKKRNENILLFEASIKNERAAIQQEETVEAALESKLFNNKLSEADREWIMSDLPKLKSTKIKRNETIALLKAAILEEQDSMDKEENMIHFLEKNNGSSV